MPHAVNVNCIRGPRDLQTFASRRIMKQRIRNNRARDHEVIHHPSDDAGSINGDQETPHFCSQGTTPLKVNDSHNDVNSKLNANITYENNSSNEYHNYNQRKCKGK